MDIHRGLLYGRFKLFWLVDCHLFLFGITDCSLLVPSFKDMLSCLFVLCIYCVFILRAISTYTRGLKRYLTHLTAHVQCQLTSNWHSLNWKIEAQE